MKPVNANDGFAGVLIGTRKWTIACGDALDVLRRMPDECVQCAVTSPPYWGLRDYGVPGQLGLEPTPDEYVANMVLVFAEVRRVLRGDGTLWLNLGDSYAAQGGRGEARMVELGRPSSGALTNPDARGKSSGTRGGPGLKPKDLVGIPWRTAFALQADGWYLRSDVIWCLSGGTRLYARTARGEGSATIKDLVRLDPSTVQLWNGSRWTQVLGWSETPRPDAPVEIELRSGERVTCTPGHMWPTQRGNVTAGALVVGDVIATTALPEPQSPNRPAALPDSEIGWFAGLYLAEGSRDTSGTIQISGNTDETTDRMARLAPLAAAFGGTCRVHRSGEHGATICMDAPVLVAVLDKYIGGRTAHDKALRPACWRRSNVFLRAVLDGYLHGDGHYDRTNDRWRLGFCRNYNLEASLRTLCARVGASLRLKLSTATMDGRRFPAFRGEIRFSERTSDGEVIAVRRGRARRFWDIGVADEPHLFALASGVLTHNSKPNPMPESVEDRPTKAHEYLFLLSKSERYYFDADAVREPISASTAERWGEDSSRHRPNGTPTYAQLSGENMAGYSPAGRNIRTVWTITTKPYAEAHFATFPPELPERCIKAGTSERGVCRKCGAPWERLVEDRSPQGIAPPAGGPKAEASQLEREAGGLGRLDGGRRSVADSTFNNNPAKRPPPPRTTGWQPGCDCNSEEVPAVVLDPFAGAGTTIMVARRLQRRAIGIELNPAYVALAEKRIDGDAPLFNREVSA